ncbi:hypothetical protein D9O50_17150 [Oxalobacteraceae bacterium CAVE-383]|nr:hypothetical protein D9O50_17150 [Oxalobacteraceae bacterium CAVE-383]
MHHLNLRYIDFPVLDAARGAIGAGAPENTAFRALAAFVSQFCLFPFAPNSLRDFPAYIFREAAKNIRQDSGSKHEYLSGRFTEATS